MVGPIALGTLIYIGWRSTRLRVFHWVAAVGLEEAVVWLRQSVAHLEAWLPDWLLYCLPDGLWVYAATVFFARIWADQRSLQAWAWTLLCPVLGVGGELGQALGVVPGTFDWIDFVVSVAAAVGGVVVGRRLWRLSPSDR